MPERDQKTGLAAWVDRLTQPPPTVPVVRLTGSIGAAGTFRRGLNLASVAGPLQRAFSVKKAPAVALAINSPGGSPVQSALIARRIRDLAEEKKKKVFAFVEDVAASGGYWIACAADEIYADESSIVGSIGVVSAGFGFPDFIGRYGIERRVHTSGTRKLILDPFQPERSEDVDKLKAIQSDIHEAFRQLVRDRRGDRLKADEATLFEGEFWAGVKGKELGLVDGIGHLRPVMREKFGKKVRLRTVPVERGWLRRRMGLTGGAPAGRADPEALADDFGRGLLAAMEERAIWQRFDL
jgi:signal peptide peptidase SppA